MDNEFLKRLFKTAQESLREKAASLGNAEDGNAVLSYQRVIEHLSDFIPPLHSQLVQHGASLGGSDFGDNAWWRVQFHGLDFSIDLEHRYFDPGASRLSLKGKRRADVVLEIGHRTRKVRVLLEYKTSKAGDECGNNVLEHVFEEQLIPYLNHEVAQLLAIEDDATDQFFCCVAVSLRDHTGETVTADQRLLVKPDRACALLRKSSLPTLEDGDTNQLCYFVFEQWLQTTSDQSFHDWLFGLIKTLLSTDKLTLPAPKTEASDLPGRELCIVYGPPGSGKSSWIRKNFPTAKIFAPPRLQKIYPAPSAPDCECLVVDEWQHMGLRLSSPLTNPVINAIAGGWEKLVVIVDLGQARQDNKRWPANAYEDIQQIVARNQRAPVTAMHIPLWIPVRQRQLGIAFMLWLEAVRRALVCRDTRKFTGLWLSPDGAAAGFKNARALLVRTGMDPETLFDISVIDRSQLQRQVDGIRIDGIGVADIVLQRQRAHGTHENASDTLLLRPERPVDVAGLEYNTVIVNLEHDAAYTSNEINEVLLACSRATRRLCLLVHKRKSDGTSPVTPEETALFDSYKLFGIESLATDHVDSAWPP